MTTPASHTAVVVASGRAFADAGGTNVVGYVDPVSSSLLPERWRRRVARALALQRLLPVVARRWARTWVDAIVLRTLAIDDAVLTAANSGIRQLVVLAPAVPRSCLGILPSLPAYPADQAPPRPGRR